MWPWWFWPVECAAIVLSIPVGISLHLWLHQSWKGSRLKAHLWWVRYERRKRREARR